jgi:hypothetical protein
MRLNRAGEKPTSADVPSETGRGREFMPFKTAELIHKRRCAKGGAGFSKTVLSS